MKRPTDTETDFDLRRSIARLAPYRPFDAEGKLKVEIVHRELILVAIQENGGTVGSIGECQDICNALWEMELEIHDIRDVVQRLQKAGKLEKAGKAGYELTPAAAKELADRVREASETEAVAFNQWETTLVSIAPGLTTDQVSQLRDDLGSWLHEIVARHGIEAAALLYPEDPRLDALGQQITVRGFGFLPPREKAITAVRADAFYAFVRQPTPEQRRHFAELLEAAYLVSIFTIDPEAHEIVQSITAGQRIYLDTNVVYRLLNLRTPREHMAVKRVIEMTRQLGYEICVTPWTVDEMKESVRRARTKLSQSALPPRALAELAAETANLSDDDAFVIAYWRKFKEHGVSPQDFLNIHEQIEPMLAEYGVTVRDNGCTAVDRSEEQIQEQIAQLDAAGGVDRPLVLKEHDVKHRLLVERLRGSSNRGFSNAGCFFLTADGVLPRYARSHRVPNQPPFTVSLSAWAHIVRSLCPRTTDYEQTIVDVLATTAIRRRGVLDQGTVAEVLGRVDMLTEDSTAVIATRVMLDTAMMQKVQASKGAQRKQLIDRLVIEKKNELETQLHDVQAAVDAERLARAQAERTAEERAAELEKEREARAAAEERAASVAREREQLAAEHDESVRAAQQEAEAEASRRRAEAERQGKEIDDLKGQVASHVKVARIILAGLLTAVAIATVAVPLATGWATGGWPLVTDCSIAVGVLGVAAWIQFGKKRAAAVVAAFITVLTVVSGFAQLVGTDKPASTKPPSRK